MVVNDYAKAKSLVSENAPIVFKKGKSLNRSDMIVPLSLLMRC